MSTLSPLKAIREKCVDCSGGSRKEADNCHLEHCPLHAYRKGSNPNRKKRVLSEEQKAKLRANMAAARAARKTTI